MTSSKVRIGQINVGRRNMYDLIIKSKNDKYDLLLLSDVSIHHNIKDHMGELIVSNGEFNDAAIMVLNKDIKLGKLKITDHMVSLDIDDIGIRVTSIYIRPEGNPLRRELGINCLKNLLRTRRRWSLIGGDLNFHAKEVGYCKQDHINGNDLLETIIDLGWCVSNEPKVYTHEHGRHLGKATPDWTIVTADITHRVQWEIDSKFDNISDHRMIKIEIDKLNSEHNTRTVVRFGKFIKAITNPNRNIDVEHWYQNYSDAIKSASVVRQEKQWTSMVPPDNRQLKNKLNYIGKIIKKKGVNCEQRWKDMYADLRREYRSQLTTWRKERRKTYRQSINTNNMYKLITRPIKMKNVTITHLITTEGKIVDQQRIIDTLLNHHYAFEEPESFDHIISNTAYDPPINDWEIGLAMDSFQPNKAPGMDGVDIKLAKAWRSKDKDYFDGLFKHWWNIRKFPEELKIANIIILKKKDDKELTVDNTRLIGLLSIMGKILERIISYRIAKKLLTDKRLHQNQFGFLPGKSSEMGINKIHNIRQQNNQLNRIELLIALDIKSAFDKIKHSALIGELNKMNVARNIIELLKSYFTNRQVRIQLGSVDKTIQVNRGLVQGSKLSPLCFVTAIDRVLKAAEKVKSTENVQAEVIAYADDITIIASHTESYNKIRNYVAQLLAAVNNELKAVGLSLSPEKTTIMTNYVNPPGSIRIYNKNIEIKEQVKILGVIFNKQFNYDDHLNYIESKLQSKLVQLRKSFGYGDDVSLEVRRIIAATVVVPMVLYGSNTWYSDKAKIIQRLKRMYKSVARTVINAYRTSSHAALSILSGIQPLHLQCQTKLMKQKQQDTGRCLDNLVMSTNSTICNLPDPWISPGITFRGEIRKNEDVLFGEDEYVIYTDGSRGADNEYGKSKVGAALVIMKGSQTIDVLKFKLLHYNSIFEAESLAVFKAIEYAHQMNWTTVNVVSDSKSTVNALTGNKWKNELILDTIKLVISKRITVNIWWCKAHAGIIGNELVDSAAKEAKETGILFYRPASKSYGDMLIRKAIREKAVEEFKHDIFGRTIKLFIDSPEDKTAKLIHVNSQTTQIYTGHGPYMNYLHEIGKAASNWCSCSDQVQDVKHLLMECQYFSRENYETAIKLGLSSTEWRGGWNSVNKSRHFHAMIRQRAWKINTEIHKINYMRILPRGHSLLSQQQEMASANAQETNTD